MTKAKCNKIKQNDEEENAHENKWAKKMFQQTFTKQFMSEGTQLLIWKKMDNANQLEVQVTTMKKNKQNGNAQAKMMKENDENANKLQ